jgi:FkbM family methyltransferase
MTYYGQWNPPQDEVAYKNYFTNYSMGWSLECGASSGGTGTHFFLDLGWECAFIEPSKYAFSCLKNYLEKPNAYLYNFALSNKNGKAIFKDIISAPGGGNDNGSLHHTDAHMKELLGYGCTFEDYEVETKTFSNFCTDPHDPSRGTLYDFFVLDVEGHELEVIEGITFAAPRVICVEYTITGLDKLINALTPKRYSLDFISFNNAYFSQGYVEKKEHWFGETERMEEVK